LLLEGASRDWKVHGYGVFRGGMSGMAIRTHFDGVWRAVFADGSWVSWNLPNLFDPPSSPPEARNNSTRCSILALALLLLCSQPRHLATPSPSSPCPPAAAFAAFFRGSDAPAGKAPLIFPAALACLARFISKRVKAT
jgi:hypothetical protein